MSRGEWLLQIDKTDKDLYNTVISVAGKPIESLFSRVLQLTNIQNVSFAIPESRLNVHIFEKLAAALILLAYI
jgi:hypothetical protein